jgi:flagellar M-ring protein FliF
MQGVKSARVMVVLPESRLLVRTTDSRPTASVFVDTGSNHLDKAAVNSIRSLVASSVEGLKVDDVAVIDNSGNVLSEDLKSDPQLGNAASVVKYRQQTEDYLSSKVETMLSESLGPGNCVVRVSATINTEAATMTEERFDPEGQVPRQEVTVEDSTSTNETGAEPAPRRGSCREYGNPTSAGQQTRSKQGQQYLPFFENAELRDQQNPHQHCQKSRGHHSHHGSCIHCRKILRDWPAHDSHT